MKWDFLVVGAGFAGSVCAERMAAAGYKVLVIDRRSHVGGNAHDRRDEHGLLIHPYGPHIFHTNLNPVVEYLSRFTNWRFYEHRVLARVNDDLYPIPINRTTINKLYGLHLDEAGVARFLESVREDRGEPRTSEDVVLRSVGRDLCDKFFRGYTRKQWNRDLSELSASVAARIPTRTNDDDRYFTDAFQFMPAEGFGRVFQRMLAHPNITVRVEAAFRDVAGELSWDHLIYTGPLDEYYDHRFGRLPYRSLRFEHQHLPGVERFQPVGTVNYPNDFDYTRITEFKHITGDVHSGTSIVREYALDEGDPYYPVPNPETDALVRRYQELAEAEASVTFIGRLAQYKYYNMDQVVNAALIASDGLLARKRFGSQHPGRAG